jgi:hypothetical protein
MGWAPQPVQLHLLPLPFDFGSAHSLLPNIWVCGGGVPVALPTPVKIQHPGRERPGVQCSVQSPGRHFHHLALLW